MYYHYYVVLLIDDEFSSFDYFFFGTKSEISLILLKLADISLNKQLAECTRKNHCLGGHHSSIYDVTHERYYFCCELDECIPYKTKLVIHAIAYTLKKLRVRKQFFRI